MSEELLARIDRLESIDAIRQLAAKYSLALDMRDANAWVGLFPEDVKVGAGQVGRAAMRAWFDDTMRLQFTGTSHHIGGHIIEFDDPDHAKGVVYSKNEHETGDEWVIMQMMYVDKYDRIDGRWYFRRRLPLYWYATDLNKPPIGDNKMRWPDQDAYAGGYHDYFPSWKEFWARAGDDGSPVAEPAPLEGFLDTMSRGATAPKIRVR
ncbi:nuclear transport factor 2 family protein [Sphingomonas montanisoli]|uniref:Nuclear transport factor 2 family protein n=1 Tax=Sphingomonas montanisoli TaxID=2606412 RepID=A0A5D9C2K5_9SPHN|nr:nuclear transport factor 2 family protein [Sphingomonas montanisoli]TZG24135.1 nuclear transport factor 2 family protein [Sphingomonas montanisoli]